VAHVNKGDPAHFSTLSEYFCDVSGAAVGRASWLKIVLRERGTLRNMCVCEREREREREKKKKKKKKGTKRKSSP
jgi:hypothetical protein